MKNRLLIIYDGYTSPFGVVAPPFEGDAAARAFITNRVRKDFAGYDIEVTDVNDPNDTRPTAIVAVGGGSATQGGGAITGGFRRQGTMNNAVVYAKNFQGNLIWIAKAISHETGHLGGLYDALVNGEYRKDGAIMGSYWSPDGVEPFWLPGDVKTLTETFGTASPAPAPTPQPEPMDAATKTAILSFIASQRAGLSSLEALTGTTPPPNPTTDSPDGTRVSAPDGKVTSNGTVFSFGAPAPGGYAILVNGSPVGGGISLGIKGGAVYSFNDRGNWWKWTGANWQLSSDPFM